MLINLDSYKQGEPITIIFNGIFKTFYEPTIIIPTPSPIIEGNSIKNKGLFEKVLPLDYRRAEELGVYTTMLNFELGIHGKTVKIDVVEE